MDLKPVTVSDTLIIIVTFLGPIIAVQLQKFIERRSAGKNNKEAIFRTLMATRAIRAGSPDHVQALNMIDLYYASNSVRDKSVRTAWKIYFDALQQPIDPRSPDIQSKMDRHVDLLVDLLHAMSGALGYDFDKVQIKRGAYYPQSHFDDLIARQIIREGMVRVAQGQAALPVVFVQPSTASDTKNIKGDQQ